MSADRRALALPRLARRVRSELGPALAASPCSSWPRALCLWNLTISGYSNTYYAAAAKSATESWKALFFGSIDPGGFITVDKPPLSLWLMGIWAVCFGFSSFFDAAAGGAVHHRRGRRPVRPAAGSSAPPRACSRPPRSRSRP